jgi:hypothetical protein
MQKQYIYPQNMRTQAKLWFWNLKDVIILAIALTISVVSWAKLGFILPAALTLGYAFLSIRMDEYSVLDFIRRAWRYFVSTQQYFEWKEREDG